MFGSFLITEIRGVPVRIHFTALLLLFLIYNVVPSILVALVYSVLILLSVTLHELGHAVVSQRYGVSVQDIILTPIGGVARLRGLPDNPRHEIRIALAGPYVSLLLFVAGLAATLAVASMGWRVTAGFLSLFTSVNLMLLLFNLLPSFPMDGGRVLRGWLTQKKGALEATRIAAQIGRYMSFVFIGIGLVTGRFPLSLIGIFILLSAGSEYRMMQVKHWRERQLGGTPSPVEADFVASPPPYAEPSGPSIPNNFLGDMLITFQDLVAEVCASCFKSR